MPLRACLVTLTDERQHLVGELVMRGIRHSVDVTAESLYEAAILGVQLLRREVWIEDGIGLGTRIEVEVREPSTHHTVTLQQIERWLNGATSSPNERVKKDRLKQLLRQPH